jgi:exopolysaccharide biosynthesis polyprenyl glycosylphosphotransferase
MKKIPIYKYFFAISDFLIAILCFLSAGFIVRRNSKLSLVEFLQISSEFLAIIFFLALVILLIFEFNGLYKINVILPRSMHLARLIKSILYASGTVIISSFVLKASIIDSRLFIISFTLLALIMFFVIRVEFLRFLYKRFVHAGYKRNILIVGDGNAGKLLATKLYFEDSEGINLVGFVLENKKLNDEVIFGKKVLGNLNQLEFLAAQYEIDEIIIALDEVSYDQLFNILEICQKLKINIRLRSDLFKIVTSKIKTERYAEVPLIDVSPKYNSWISFGFKKIFDIVAASFILLLISPFMLLVALVIKITSPGPILFSQVRIGKDGKPFRFYKFRSMYNLQHEDNLRMKQMIDFMNGTSGPGDTKVVNEARITKIGKLLRKTSLDELPQLFNVIKGEMSLVGPRPCLPYEYENYNPWQKRRLKVLPGCTGVWQTFGRSSVSFVESIILDLYYVNNMSPWFDLQLMLKTIPVMLFSRGGK